MLCSQLCSHSIEAIRASSSAAKLVANQCIHVVYICTYVVYICTLFRFHFCWLLRQREPLRYRGDRGGDWARVSAVSFDAVHPPCSHCLSPTQVLCEAAFSTTLSPPPSATAGQPRRRRLAAKFSAGALRVLSDVVYIHDRGTWSATVTFVVCPNNI